MRRAGTPTISAWAGTSRLTTLPAPEFGQHTEQVLVDELGWSWERVGELKERGVI